MKSSRSPEIKLLPNESIDLFMDGRLKLIQSKKGYRFSIDALMIADFVTVKHGDVVVDLGTGCGVILLILLLTKPVGHVYGLEIQEELATQAKRNAGLNRFEDKTDIILGDIRHPPISDKKADLIICNPPYREVKSGRINPDPCKAIARHEIMSSIDDILGFARGILKKKGRLALIYPSVRLVDILVKMRHFNLEPKRVQIYYPDVNSEANLALIEASLNGKPGLKIERPVIGQKSFFTVPEESDRE